MKSSLREYPNNNVPHQLAQKEPGPVITLSRSYGCDEQPFVDRLLDYLNHQNAKRGKSHRWSYASHLIMDKTARRLHLEAYDVENRVMEHGLGEDWNAGPNVRHTAADLKMIKTIKELMVKSANRGNVIFVGRGGKSVLHHIPNSLHLKLTAPLSYRIDQVTKNMHMRPSDAEEMILSIDKQRILWTEHLIDEPFDEDDFDLTLNAASLSTKEMVAVVVQILNARKLIGMN